MKKRKKSKPKPERNSDAQQFIDRVKFRRRQECELENMDKSFERDRYQDPQEEFFYMTQGL